MAPQEPRKRSLIKTWFEFPRVVGWGGWWGDIQVGGDIGKPMTDWFQIGKGVRQGCILSPYLFNLYAEYIMRNAGPEEAQAGIKIARRNINNLRCR